MPGIGDVAGERVHRAAAAEARGGELERGRAPGGEHQVVAELGQQAGEREAQPSAGTRDQRARSRAGGGGGGHAQLGQGTPVVVERWAPGSGCEAGGRVTLSLVERVRPLSPALSPARPAARAAADRMCRRATASRWRRRPERRGGSRAPVAGARGAGRSARGRVAGFGRGSRSRGHVPRAWLHLQPEVSAARRDRRLGGASQGRVRPKSQAGAGR